MTIRNNKGVSERPLDFFILERNIISHSYFRLVLTTPKVHIYRVHTKEQDPLITML